MNARLRYKIPPPEMCVTCYEARLATDGQTVRCRCCSGESLLSEWNRKVARFVRDTVRRFKRGAV